MDGKSSQLAQWLKLMVFNFWYLTLEMGHRFRSLTENIICKQMSGHEDCGIGGVPVLVCSLRNVDRSGLSMQWLYAD